MAEQQNGCPDNHTMTLVPASQGGCDAIGGGGAGCHHPMITSQREAKATCWEGDQYRGKEEWQPSWKCQAKVNMGGGWGQLPEARRKP